MNIEQLKKNIVTNVYQIDSEKKVALHKHDKHNEIFYCISGSGYGVLENSEIKLDVGDIFNVEAGILHSLRSEDTICVASFLIPIIEED